MPLLSTSPLGSIGFYDKHNLKLSHNSKGKVTFKIDVEPNDHGFRITYQTVAVKSGETFEYSFPETFQSRWIRFVDDKACVASTWFEYR